MFKLRLLMGCVVIASVMNIFCSEDKLKEYPLGLIPLKAYKYTTWQEKALSILDMLENINTTNAHYQTPLSDAINHSAPAEYIQEIIKRKATISCQDLGAAFEKSYIDLWPFATEIAREILDERYGAERDKIGEATLELLLVSHSDKDVVMEFNNILKEISISGRLSQRTQAIKFLDRMFIPLR